MRRSFITGFTLAEVLITLTIIGVIAALTIPALIQDVQDAQFKTAYKKAFSVANQAITKAYNDNLLSPMANGADAAAVLTNFNAFMNEFVVTKKCSFDAYNCWDSSGEFLTSPGNVPQPSASAFIDSSGMAWCAYNIGTAYGEGLMMLDTNGNNGPNHYGKDRWFLALVNASGSTAPGIPVKIVPISSVEYASWYCHYPRCPFTSWLKQ